MKLFILSIFFFIILIGSTSASSRLDSLLVVLDNTIKNEKQYTENKKNHINSIKLQLNNQNQNPKDLYRIYQNLVNEYESFIGDSARVYILKAMDIANDLQDNIKLQDCKIRYAMLQSKAAMFSDAIDILNQVNRNILTQEQLVPYYKAYIDTYVYWMEYHESDIWKLYEIKRTYQDSLLQIVPRNTFDYAISYGTKYIEINDFDKAEKILLSFYPQIKPETKEHAVYTSILAYLYEKKDDTEKQKEYLALSAISDIKALVKENVSLRTLALLLFNDGDINRAYSYIKQSLEDANYYNGKLRNIQVSRLLPVIDKAYQLERERQENKLRTLLILVSILSLFLIGAVYFVIKQVRKLSRSRREILQINNRLNQLIEDLKLANDHQKNTNISLAESNRVKEKFISNFLEICAEYINKLENFKITVNRRIKAGQTNEILKMTSSSEDSARELKELYTNFDKAFLSIYPNFVEDINKLLRADEYYPISKDQSLNHELRVFALIKLGITDSNKIASFLHYTLRTVYNYRSRVKSKSLYQDDNFEDRIKQISESIY